MSVDRNNHIEKFKKWDYWKEKFEDIRKIISEWAFKMPVIR